MKTVLIVVFSYLVLCFPILIHSTTIINEEFEQVAFPPLNWTQNQISGTNTWVLGTGSSNYGNNLASYSPVLGGSARLVTPSFTVLNGMYLGFSFYHTNTNVNLNDRIQMQIRINNVWQNLGAPIPRYMADTNPVEYYDYIANHPWKNHFSNLSSFLGQNVCLGFLAISEGGEALKIDQIQVFSNPEGTVLADDFNDNIINSGLYRTYLYNVTETGQTMQMTNNQIDQPGILISNYLALGVADSLIITRKVKVHYANEYFIGQIGIAIDNVLQFGILYSNYSFNSPGSPYYSYPSYGIRINRNCESPGCCRNLQNLSNTVTCPWNTWFDEKVAYNFTTGMVSYYINGQFQLSMFVGISNSTEHFAQFQTDASGWYTGHYLYMDDLTVKSVINTPRGSLTGLVSTSSGPLAGATVSIANSSFASQTTDASGHYSFPQVSVGTNQVTASKPGYSIVTQPAIIVANQLSTLNFTLAALPTISVSGTIVSNDFPNGLVNANINIIGTTNYNAVTNAQGLFTISNVLANQTLSYTVSKAGYQTFAGTLNIGTVNYNFGTVILNEVVTPVGSVIAILNSTQTQVNITWTHNLTRFSSIPTSSMNQYPKIANSNDNRSFLGYKVWRLFAGQDTTETSWVSLTPTPISTLAFQDTSWPTLSSNNYKWAVKAVYTNNVLSLPSFSNTLDHIPPTGTISLSSPVNGTWNSNRPSFAWSQSGLSGATSMAIVIDGTYWIRGLPTSYSSYQIPADSLALSEGWHTWTVRALDATGNWVQATQSWSIRVDATAPAQFSLNAPTENLWLSTQSPTFIWNASMDNGSGLSKYQVFVNNTLKKDNIAPTTTQWTAASGSLSDNCDAGISNWNTTGTWGLTTSNPHSGSYCITDSPSGNYSGNQNYSITLAQPILLNNATTMSLTYWWRCNLESGWDYVYVEISNNGTSWTQLANYSSTVSTWTQATHNLNSYAGWTQIYIRYRITTDSSGMNDGFYFDDLALTSNGAGLADGNYQWTVKAVDNVGNVQPSTDTRTLHIDTMAPHGSPNAFANLTPANNAWSADSLITFTWSPCIDDGIGLNHYELWIDGAMCKDSLTVTQYQLRPSQVLASGNHNWYVKAYDSLGNNTSSTAYTLKIDRIPPSDFTLSSPINGSYFIMPTPTFTWNTTTDSGSGISHYELWINGTLNIDNLTQTSTSPANALTEGSHPWYVVAVDNVGNRKQSTAIWTTIGDWNPPTQPVLTSPINNQIVSISRPNLVWQKSTDAGTGVHHYSIYIDNVLVTASYIPSDLNAQVVSTQSPNPLVNGNHTWYIKAFDNAGGESSSTYGTFVVNVDITPPTSSIINPVMNQYIGGESYTITGSASDNTGGSGVQKVEISFDGGNTWFLTTHNSRSTSRSGSSNFESAQGSYKIPNLLKDNSSDNLKAIYSNARNRDSYRDVYNWQFVWTGYQTGSLTIKTRATDMNNNVETPPFSLPVFVEKIVPVIQSINVNPNYAKTGTVIFTIAFQTGTHCGSMNNSVTPTVTITPAGGTTRAVTQTNYQGNTWTGQTTIAQSDMNGTAVISVSNGKDNINNQMVMDATHTFVIDTQAPNAFNLISPVNNAWLNQAQPQLTWGAATDVTSGIDHYALEIDGSTNSPGNANISSTLNTIQPAAVLTMGIHNWRIKAFDRAGNFTWSTSTFSFGLDLTPPVSGIAAPTNNSTIGGLAYTIAGTSSDGTGASSSGVASVQIRINGGNWLNVVNTGTNYSTWTYSWAGYTSGTYTLQSRATDNAGSVETSPLTTTVSVNLNPPTVQSITIAPTPAKAGVVTCTAVFTANNAGLNYSIHPTIWFTTPNSNIVNFTETSYSGNQWVGTATVTGTTQNGIAIIHTTGVTDNYNNVMAPNQNAGTFVIDTVAPTVSSIVVNPQITNIRTDLNIQVNFAVDTAGLNSTISPVVTIIPLGSGVSNYISVLQTGYNVATRIWSGVATINAQSLEGIAAVKVASAIDLAGNVMQIVTLQNQFTIDRSAPLAFNILQPVEASWTSNRQPQISWSPSSDAISGLSCYKLYINDNQVGNNILPTITSSTVQTSLPDGGYQVRVAAYDNAQTPNTCLSGTATTLFHVDGSAPISLISSPVNGYIVQGNAVTITGTAMDGVGVNAGIGVRYVYLSKNGGSNWDLAYEASTQSQGAVNWNYTYNNLVPGNHTISVKATDWLGNAELSTSSISITVQANAPVANFSANIATGVAPLNVNFTDTSTQGTWPIISWLWNFGDTFTSTSQNPTHIYATRGVYTVSLTVRDAYNTAHTRTVTNMINVLNQAPAVTLPMPDLTRNEDFTPIVINLNTYFADGDGDALVYTVAVNPVQVNATVTGSTLTINSVLNYSGSVSLNVTANDQYTPPVLARTSNSQDRATCSDTFILTINPVNDAPLIALPASFTFAEDGSLEVNIAPYVSDVDNATLTVTSANTAHISVVMNGSTATLTSSVLNWNGSELVSFTVSDGLLQSTGQVNVIVTPVNDAPVINNLPASFTFVEDGSLLIDMALYATDLDNATLTLSATNSTHIVSTINGMTATLTATADWNGTESITFTVDDNMGVVARGKGSRQNRLSVSATADIIVTPVNDVPVIVLPPSLTFAEDGSLEVDIAPYVSDVDNAALTVTSANTAHISVVMNGFTATLTSSVLNWNGSELVSFTVSDGLLTVTGQTNVIVTPVNDSPVLDLPPLFTYAEDGNLPINLALYASDVDNANLTLTASGNVNVTVGIVGLNVTLGTLLNWNGTEQLIFTVSDNMGRAIASDSTEIIVTPVNDAPIISSFSPTQTTLTLQQNDIQTFSVIAIDVDSDVFYSWFINGVNQDVSLNTFEHQFTQSNTYEVKVEVTDNLLTVEQIWTVTVPVANDDPIVTPLATRLYPNYPNPFNPETTIQYSLKNAGWVDISVYNVNGQLIRNLKNGNDKSGTHSLTWNGRNNDSKAVASGMYYIRMKTTDGINVIKMTLMK